MLVSPSKMSEMAKDPFTLKIFSPVDTYWYGLFSGIVPFTLTPHNTAKLVIILLQTRDCLIKL